ncbi:uncharacterized protein LOC118766362 isoform X2 [Octopus sinensis]|uniref:Uncharacterized protein LOC118766362 isoform X2 n=1 Tax=Octopus sinensis TaxID=2607531 RepID=A0A7E6FD34_9MOLL|nr:uncharacterized protein LOC118766362 isoform X2 [Octopus sinensis]
MSRKSYSLTSIKAFYILVIFSVVLVSLAMTYGYFANSYLIREKVNRMYKLSSGQDFKGKISMNRVKYFDREAHRRDKYIELKRKIEEGKVTPFAKPLKRSWADEKRMGFLSESGQNKTIIFPTSKTNKNDTWRSFYKKDKTKPLKFPLKFGEQNNKWKVKKVPSQYKRNNTGKSLRFPSKGNYNMKKYRNAPLKFGEQKKLKRFPSQFKRNNIRKSLIFPLKGNMKKYQKAPLKFGEQWKVKKVPSQYKRNNTGKSLIFPLKGNMKKYQKAPLKQNNIWKVQKLPSQFKRNNTRKSLVFPSKVNYDMKKSQKSPLKFGELNKWKFNVFSSKFGMNKTGKPLEFPSKIKQDILYHK